MLEYWTELIIGIIMIASPWVLGFSDISLAKWCNVLIGLLLMLISAWMIFGAQGAAMPTMATMQESQKGKRKTKSNNSVEPK
jgi:hypothetical protein